MSGKGNTCDCVTPGSKQQRQEMMTKTPTVTNRKQLMIPVSMVPPRIRSFKASLLPPPGASTATTASQNLVVPSKHHAHRRVNSALPPNSSDNNNDIVLVPMARGGTNSFGGNTPPVSPPSSGKALGLGEPGSGTFHNHPIPTHHIRRRPTHLSTATITKAHKPILYQINEARSKLHATTKCLVR